MSLIGIDYGARRIGVAVSDSGVLATPHSVVPNEEDAVDRIATIAGDVGAELVVVGLARRARTTDGEEKFRTFAEALRQKICKPVVLWDETLSTVEATERLSQSGRRKSRRKDDIDMYAAAVILQSWIDARGAGRTS